MLAMPHTICPPAHCQLPAHEGPQPTKRVLKDLASTTQRQTLGRIPAHKETARAKHAQDNPRLGLQHAGKLDQGVGQTFFARAGNALAATGLLW